MTSTGSAFAPSLREHGYVHDDALDIWCRGDRSSPAHSDEDDAEHRIWEVVRRASDVSLFSSELRQHETDGPVTHPLSATRANLLRPLAVTLKGARVLEIGAGYGSITRYLGEEGSEVLALEANVRRASIVASRCRDLANVTVLNDRFDALHLAQKFDVITLIGVLDFARNDTRGLERVRETLRQAGNLLTDEGILIVAVGSQPALAQCADDAIHVHHAASSAKVELQSHLIEAGFHASEWAMAMPDYGLPHCVILPAGLAAGGPFKASRLVRQFIPADRQHAARTRLSPGRDSSVLGRSGPLADTASSWLVVAQRTAASPSLADIAPGLLAEQYASGRAPAFAKLSRFVEVDNVIRVHREKLGRGAVKESALLAQSLRDEPFLVGTYWVDALASILTKPGWNAQQVAEWFDTWKRALAMQLPGRPPAESLQIDTQIPGSLVDAIPGNLIKELNGQPSFFDLEWTFKAPLTFGHLAFRAIKHSLDSLAGVAMPGESRLLHVPALVRAVLREHGLVVTSSDVQSYLNLEAKVRADVLGGDVISCEVAAYQEETLGLARDGAAMPHDKHLPGDEQNAAATKQEKNHLAKEAPRDALADAFHALLQDYGKLQQAFDDLQASRPPMAVPRERPLETVNELGARAHKAAPSEDLTPGQGEESKPARNPIGSPTAHPLRSASALVRQARSGMRRSAVAVATKAYRATPLSPAQKRAVKRVIFSRTGWVFGRTAAYQRWAAFERTHAPNRTDSGVDAAVSHTLAAHHDANPVWLADGVREWADYASVRERIDTAFTEQRSAKNPRKKSVLDFSRLDVDTAASRVKLPKPPESPDVTILVPVYNHLTTTLECLASIGAEAKASGPSFEVLIADDASSDNSTRVLGSIPHVRVVTQPNNLGFLRNCNSASKYANGRLIVLLNNDVQVTDGWLEALVRCIDSSPDIGAAGPRIVYPSGWLQEAGTTLRADGTSEMVGLNDLPDQPRYAFERDVDYCSGACLMIRTEDFDRIGGFDETYAPAYCEDSDLCMRLRAEGRRIVYCPEATVLHHLSRTSDGLQSDYKLRCISTNLAKFTSRWRAELDHMDDVRTIAFYLPQFHPFPENDLWWGQGFTEWTNVTKARPNYVGHYQPRVPADLGYYDLRVTETMEKQAALARRYGLGGFCYYYYWFGGHRLLERPIEAMLQSGRPDFPFCLCWANENWTRRWDGQEHDVLMAQKHSDEDDVAVIRDLIRYFRNANYIRINGKPLILVYRITLFPDFARTSAIWRQVCRDEGIGDIYIAQVESFELVSAGIHPAQRGCDAAVEFPPQGMAEPRSVTAPLLNSEFQGAVADYRDIAVRYATRELPAYKRFMSVMPGWDNTARRQNNSYAFDHATPGAFQAWLETTITRTKQQYTGDERLVFINAWNEWAEGAYLEPDRRFGHSFLEAHRNALDSDRFLRKARYSLG